MRRLFLLFIMGMSFALLTTSCSKEGSEGGEGSGGEGGNESGTLWSCNETADEIVNGVRLILDYDPISMSFVGKLENLNTVVAPQVRVEVHVFDSSGKSTEYGPTTPADMKPGETRNVTLSVAGISECFEFNMHPEVGSGTGGEGSGGEGSGGEGSGGEGGSGGEAGNESGMLWDIGSQADETVNGVRLKLKFNDVSQAFEGTLENINTTIAPMARMEIHVFDAQNKSTEYGPTTPADMQPGETRQVSLLIGNSNFVKFNMHPEVG